MLICVRVFCRGRLLYGCAFSLVSGEVLSLLIIAARAFEILFGWRRGHKKMMQTIREPQREPLVNDRIMHTLFAHLFLSLDLVSAHAIATMHEMRYDLEAPKGNFSVC